MVNQRASAPCAGDKILVGTPMRVRRIIMEKGQRSPLPANDLNSRPSPRLVPPVPIERPTHKSRNLWREAEGAFPSVLCGRRSATMTRIQRVVLGVTLEKAFSIYVSCKDTKKDRDTHSELIMLDIHLKVSLVAGDGWS